MNTKVPERWGTLIYCLYDNGDSETTKIDGPELEEWLGIMLCPFDDIDRECYQEGAGA